MHYSADIRASRSLWSEKSLAVNWSAVLDKSLRKRPVRRFDVKFTDIAIIIAKWHGVEWKLNTSVNIWHVSFWNIYSTFAMTKMQASGIILNHVSKKWRAMMWETIIPCDKSIREKAASETTFYAYVAFRAFEEPCKTCYQEYHIKPNACAKGI